MTENRTYTAARFYVQECGFSIVPLHERSKARLFKGTVFDQKTPDERHLTRWYVQTCKHYNLAIVPGEISGNLVILDFDEPGSFDAWQHATGIETPRVISGRGVHVYVRLEQMVMNGKGYFQDTRFGDIIAHGNITAPPSVHPCGHKYRWEGNPRAVPLFPCLASLSVERRKPDGGRITPRKPMPSPASFSGTIYGVDWGKVKNKEAYIMSAVRRESENVASGAEGTRNHILYRAALNLAKFISVTPQGTIEDELHAAALRSGMSERDDSISATIRSGLRTGIQRGTLT